MTDMVCDNCGRTGIRWMGLLSNPTGTECPHCGGQNCQRVPVPEDDDESAPYTCISCVASTWNDDDLCDACRNPSLDGEKGE